MKHLLCALACILSISLVSFSIFAGEEPEERNRYGVGISFFEESFSFVGSTDVTDLTGGVDIYLYPPESGGTSR